MSNKTEKNKHVFNTNAKIGQVMIVEDKANTCKIHRIKMEKESAYTLNAPWWDLDGINREINEHEEDIISALHTFSVNGIKAKLTDIAAEMQTYSVTEKTECLRQFVKMVCGKNANIVNV